MDSIDERVLQAVRIILVEPAGPLNVGSIARVMKNMGLSQLVLVQPHCDPLDPQAQQMAVHAQSVLHQAVVVQSLPEALTGCQRAIATTARERADGPPLELPEVALPWLLENPAEPPGPAALIFGPEDRGLSNGELNYAQRTVAIPSSEIYPSLNLAQAVAVCTYLLRRSWLGGPDLKPQSGSSVPADLAPLDQLEAMLSDLEQLLLTIGYLYPHTAVSRMEKFRRLLHCSGPTAQELAMLRGILRQLDWALQANRGKS
ncbi:RNA methyltransferase [filamentous cyanobacterium CCP5]|nr:RNA methyltransferase [filamentous cyanobacterium CCP5]